MGKNVVREHKVGWDAVSLNAPWVTNDELLELRLSNVIKGRYSPL